MCKTCEQIKAEIAAIIPDLNNLSNVYTRAHGIERIIDRLQHACEGIYQQMPSFEEIADELRADGLTENAAYILGARQAYGIIDRRFKENHLTV